MGNEGRDMKSEKQQRSVIELMVLQFMAKALKASRVPQILKCLVHTKDHWPMENLPRSNIYIFIYYSFIYLYIYINNFQNKETMKINSKCHGNPAISFRLCHRPKCSNMFKWKCWLGINLAWPSCSGPNRWASLTLQKNKHTSKN